MKTRLTPLRLALLGLLAFSFTSRAAVQEASLSDIRRGFGTSGGMPLLKCTFMQHLLAFPDEYR
jgi:hypothetical protein